MKDAPYEPVSPESDHDLSGRLLGEFQLLRRLGRGAMAEVYLAEQSKLRRQVAVKVLRSDLARDDSYVRRFHHEAQAAASLVHANIVQIYDVGCVHGVHYIAQEYVQGMNLAQWLARHRTANTELALHVMTHVSAALAKAAERGLVHRDIKPENIMLARSGEVKVADFGLARVIGDGAATNLTQIGMTMGTPLYMSPEQVQGRSLDPRSDIYSLGVTAYHLLSGEPPFRGDSALGVAVQHLQETPRSLEELRPDLPVALSRTVHKMLAKAPADRYESAHDLLRTLRELCAKYNVEGPAMEAFAALDDTASPPGFRRTTSRLAEAMRTTTLAAQRRRRTGWIAAAAMIVAAILGGLWAWSAREPFLLAQSASDAPAKMESPYQQLMVARFQTTNKEAWLASVREYFPNDTEYVPLAEEELAMYYLQHDRLDRALEVLRQLETAEQSRYRAFALAGIIAVLTLQQDYTGAEAALPEFMKVRDSLDDDEMRNLLLYSYGRLRENARTQTNRQWDTWFENLQTEDSSPLAGDNPRPPRPGPDGPPLGLPIPPPRGGGPPRG